MAKDQACKLQVLSAKHPDLLQTVDAMFNKFKTPLQVHQMIESKYHEDVGLTAVRSYKQNHWQIFKNMVREQKATVLGIAEIIGEDGLDAGVNALLWQEMQTMTPAQLMAFKKVLNDSAKVAVAKKEFILYAQEQRQKMRERQAAIANQKEAAASDPVEDYEKAQRVVEQVKEMFGIGMTDALPPAPRQLAASRKDPRLDGPQGGGDPAAT